MSEQPNPDEYEEPQETPISPSEPETDLSEAEGFPPNVRAHDVEEEHEQHAEPMEEVDDPTEETPPFVHTPETIYVYDGSAPTSHQVLGQIEPGENQFPTDEPVMVQALEACVNSGLLRQVTPGSEQHTDEDDETVEDEPDAQHGPDASA